MKLSIHFGPQGERKNEGRGGVEATKQILERSLLLLLGIAGHHSTSSPPTTTSATNSRSSQKCGDKKDSTNNSHGKDGHRRGEKGANRHSGRGGSGICGNSEGISSRKPKHQKPHHHPKCEREQELR